MKRCIPVLLVLFYTPLCAQVPTMAAEDWAYRYASLGRVANPSWEDLARLSLSASGADLSTAEGQGFEEALFRAVADFQSSPALPAGVQERGEFLLRYLYRTLLKTYSERQTRITVILNNGSYNCVSSAVLYTIFALAVGLDVQGVMTHDHAFVTVNVGSASAPRLVDVETTNPYGFDPGNKKEFQTAFGETGFTYTRPGNYRDRINISKLELVSIILTNQMAEFDERKRVNETVPLSANRAVLLSQRANPVSSPLFIDPQTDLHSRLLYVGEKLLESGNTDDALRWGQQVQAQYPGQEQGRWMEFNYTVLINSGRNEDALRLAQQALAANPADTRWEEFTYIALNNLVGSLLNNQRIVESRRVLAANGTNLNMGHYNALNVVVTNFELVQQLNTLHSSDDIQSALNAINEAASILPRSRVDEMRSSVLVQGANLLAMEEGWRDAIVFAESALARYGKNAILESNLRAYRSNRVIELHNAFVDLWNAGNYEQARAFIREALQEFPTNAQLMQDQNFARN